VRRPTPQDLERALARRLRDVLAPDLRILFCGINPGVYSTAVGHQFARPGNRFWKALHGAGFTDRQYSPFEDRSLLALGYGITNVCPRTTARAEELGLAELLRGARRLEARVRRLRPRTLAILGVGAYRAAFERPRATLGLQQERIGGARVFVLPNPSGLNAHYSLEALVQHFGELRRLAGP
jgi:TDG/mug DNA glycosylase family protein